MRSRASRIKTDKPARRRSIAAANPAAPAPMTITSAEFEVSELCVEPAINRNPAKLIASHAHRPAFIDLIVSLNNFAAGLCNISGKREEKVLGDALLNTNAG